MSPRARIAATALASLALHALVIAGNWLPVPQPVDALRPIEARLEPLPEPKPEVAKPRPRAPRHAAPVPVPPVAAVAAVGPPLPPEPQAEAAPAEFAAPQPTAPEPPQQLALAAESSAAILRSLPRRGRITFTLLYGEDRTYIGKVVQSWEAQGGTYAIASEAETGGIVELFRPQRMRHVSKGSITAQGLRPDVFLVSRTRRGQTDASQARFNWDAGNLDYGNAREPHSAALPAGTQDLMSFIYQFVLTPPVPGRHRVPITSGSRFEVYDIDVSNEISIETPIGTLRALPVRQVPKPGAESMELWLAAEYRYLPVRIRHFDREGRFSGEQMVSEIRVSEE